MGFPDGADQGRKAKTRCTVTAARRRKQENTLIVELPIVFNNAQRPCGGCVVRFPICFGSPALPPVPIYALLVCNRKVNAVACSGVITSGQNGKKSI